MQPSEVKALLENRLDGCEFHIQGEGCNFQVVAVGEVFEGLSPVKRQQMIYGALTEEIASGALDALSIAMKKMSDSLRRIIGQVKTAGEEIASGALHAVSIKTYTPQQWQAATDNQGA